MPIPVLLHQNNHFSLRIDEKPYIILGSEVHNSACSSEEYLDNVWRRAQEINCNTIFMPVYWYELEPEEDQFSDEKISFLLKEARKIGRKLVFLWFGAWKNGRSTYVPAWIKKDTERFPRVKDASGRSLNILSMFRSQLQECEEKAFHHFIEYLRKVDSDFFTVIAIQIENEVGILGSARDYSDGAEIAFSEQVPCQLMEIFNRQGYFACSQNKSIHSWKDLPIDNADEIFMVWHYARYINHLAGIVQQNYSLPTFTNVWLPGSDDEIPGEYPSGGPVPRVLDIWKMAAPDVSFIAPDIYSFQFGDVAKIFSRPDNPLFIPETRRDQWAAANLYLAVGRYQCLAYSPFGLESIGENKSFITQRIHTDPNDKNVSSMAVKKYLSMSYKIFQNAMPTLCKKYGTQEIQGFAQKEQCLSESFQLGEYQIEVAYYHEINTIDEYIPAAGIVLREAPDRLIFIGYGFRARVCLASGNQSLDFISIENGYYDDTSRWHKELELNGDEQHIQMREEPSVLRVEFFRY